MANSPNPNYVHACTEPLAAKDSGARALASCYSADEIAELFRFYVLEAPALNPGKTTKNSRVRSLKDLGWKDSKTLNQLERKLLQASGISSFIILESTSISLTLKEMKLTDQICIAHPRCVLQRPTTLALQEDGQIERNNRKTDSSRMQCLFRHLRNGFAHGCIRVYDNRTILIEDFNKNTGQDTQTAAIFVRAQTLLDWIEIVETQGKEGTK